MPIASQTDPPGEPASVLTDAVLRLSVEQRQAWRHGRRIPVETYLSRHREIGDDDDAVLDLIYHEVVLREQAGEHPQLDEYRERFPALAEELARLFDVHEAIEGSDVGDDSPGTDDDSTFRGSSRQTAKGESRGSRAESQPVVEIPESATAAPPPADSQSLLSGLQGATPDSPPGVIAGYEVLEEIGRGGMGVVFKARQPGTGRLVALKLIRNGRLNGLHDLARFQSEARASARLDHPGIVPLHEVGRDGDQHFLAMHYVDGPTLAEVLRAGPLDGRQAARLVQSLADALQHAHEQGVIHRDLKPQNILLEGRRSRAQGREPASRRKSDADACRESRVLDARPRITDFGLVRLADADVSLTATGEVLGTPQYMGPEQAAGNGAVIGPSTDIYALGAILYHCLTGRPPIDGANPVEIMNHLLHDDPVPPAMLNRAIHRDLDTICLKCLEKEPRRRYRSAADLGEELRRFLNGMPIQARPVGPAACLVRWCRRRPLVAGLSASLIVLSLAMVAGSVAAAWRLKGEQAATLANLHRAQRAETGARRRLYESLVTQARLGRQSGSIGQRTGSLQSLEQAAEIARELALGPTSFETLRDEAIACFELTDATPETGWSIPGERAPPETVCFDRLLERWAFVDSARRAIRVRRFADNADLLELPLEGGPPPAAAGSREASGNVEHLRFSADGSRLLAIVSRSANASVLVWNLSDGTAGSPTVHRIDPSGRRTLADVDFLPDPHSLLLAFRGGRLEAVDSRTGQQERAWSVGGPLAGCRVAPDGRLAAVWSGSVVRLLDLADGSVTRELRHPDGTQIQCLAWNSDSRLVATGTSGHTAFVWALSDCASPLLKLEGHHAWVSRVGFGANDDVLLTASRNDGTTFLWNPWTGRRLLTLQGFGMDMSSDGCWLAGISDAQITRWQLSLAEECRSLRCVDPAYVAHRGSFSPDGRWLVTCGWKDITLWDAIAREEITWVEAADARAAVFAPDGRSIISACGDGVQIRPVEFDSETDRPHLGAPQTVRLPDDIDCFQDLDIDASGRTLAVAGQGTACLGRLAEQGHSPPGSFGAEPSPGSPRSSTFDLQSCTVVHQPGLDRVSISPDSRWIATTAHAGHGVKVWRQDGTCAADLLPDEPDVVAAFSPDGRWLATATVRELQFWETGTWQPQQRATLTGSPQTWRAVAFHPEGGLVAVSHQQFRIRLIETATGNTLAHLPTGHPHSWVAFSPDGNTLACSGRRLHVQFWNLRKIQRRLSELRVESPQALDAVRGGPPSRRRSAPNSQK